VRKLIVFKREFDRVPHLKDLVGSPFGIKYDYAWVTVPEDHENIVEILLAVRDSIWIDSEPTKEVQVMLNLEVMKYSILLIEAAVKEKKGKENETTDSQTTPNR